MAKRSPRPPNGMLRARLAEEAARLISEHGLSDYGQAKRKAAARLGVVDAGALPSNAQIEASLAARQRIFEPLEHARRLRLLRQLALQLMTMLNVFEPRLVGAVLAGTATEHSAIELHLFAGTPEDVATFLLERGLAAKDYQKRYRYAGKAFVVVPGFRFVAEGEQVYATIFPEHGLREAPLSAIDQRPMKRAGRSEILELLGDR
jgi:predicted nucleotidyltransferase